MKSSILILSLLFVSCGISAFADEMSLQPTEIGSIHFRDLGRGGMAHCHDFEEMLGRARYLEDSPIDIDIQCDSNYRTREELEQETGQRVSGFRPADRSATGTLTVSPR